MYNIGDAGCIRYSDDSVYSTCIYSLVCVMNDSMVLCPQTEFTSERNRCMF